MPVQRIPRYMLLLTELFKRTPKDHPDHKDLEAALGKIQVVAEAMNVSKREAENIHKVAEIQKELLLPEDSKFKYKVCWNGLLWWIDIYILLLLLLGHCNNNTALHKGGQVGRFGERRAKCKQLCVPVQRCSYLHKAEKERLSISFIPLFKADNCRFSFVWRYHPT